MTLPKYSHTNQVPLSLAVFLATDTYDHNPDPNSISATSFIKSLRQNILTSRMTVGNSMVDITQLMPSRIGTAIHDGIERAWKHNYKQAMLDLGYPQKVIDRILLNPAPSEITADCIPVYQEVREHKKLGNMTVSGKFDMVIEGVLTDFKTTSTYSYVTGNSTEDHRLQGSIYRWISPEIITSNKMLVQYIFTDWGALRAKTDKDYPAQRWATVPLDLLSIQDTEMILRNRINDINKYWSTPEPELPLCNDRELWRGKPTYKYYKNPDKLSRSTKNFDNPDEAYVRLASDGNVGVVITVPGQAIACRYCPAFSICSQKDDLIANGELTL